MSDEHKSRLTLDGRKERREGKKKREGVKVNEATRKAMESRSQAKPSQKE